MSVFARPVYKWFFIHCNSMLRQLGKKVSLKASVRSYSSKYPNPPSYYERKPRKYFGKLVFLTFVAGATITYNYSLYELAELYHVLPEPADKIGNALYRDNLEQDLQNLDIVKQMKANPKFISFRTWDQLQESTAGLSNFHGTIAVNGGIAIAPMHFHSQETGEDVVIIHVGKRLSGYPMIVHGGMLGMIIDEVFKRNVKSEFGIQVGNIHTKNLEINYKFPCFVNQFVVIKSMAKRNDQGLYEVQGNIATAANRLLLKAATTFESDVSPTSGGPSSSKKGWLW